MTLASLVRVAILSGVALSLGAWPARAQPTAPARINLQDEGIAQGAVRTLDFTGANIGCTVSGVTGTCTITGTLAIGSTVTGAAAGSVLVANPGTPATLGEVVAVAAGNALISGGLSLSPTMGKITPSHVTGTWPIANGGTNNTTFTSGSIPYFDGSKIAEDSSNLSYDTTNKRVGVGTATPLGVTHTVITATQGGNPVNEKFSNDANGSVTSVRKGRGTPAVPLRAKANDVLSGVSGQGYQAADDVTTATWDGTNGGIQRFFADEDFTATGHGTRWVVQTANVGAITLTERLRVRSSGNVTIGNNPGEPSTLTNVGPMLIWPQGTANPSGMASNTAGTYVKNVMGVAQQFAINDWGHITQITGSFGRLLAQTGAVSVVAVTPDVDGSYLVSANVLVTTSTTHNFTMTCAYTDEGNTARTLTFNFSSLAGAFGTTITNAGGAVPYEGVPLHIRAKAGTTITIATTGTFTTVTYNVEGLIKQVG